MLQCCMTPTPPADTCTTTAGHTCSDAGDSCQSLGLDTASGDCPGQGQNVSRLKTPYVRRVKAVTELISQCCQPKPPPVYSCFDTPGAQCRVLTELVTCELLGSMTVEETCPGSATVSIVLESSRIKFNDIIQCCAPQTQADTCTTTAGNTCVAGDGCGTGLETANGDCPTATDYVSCPTTCQKVHKDTDAQDTVLQTFHTTR